MPNRLSPAARVATSFAACAFPAARRVAAAVLHAAALVICSCATQMVCLSMYCRPVKPVDYDWPIHHQIC